MKNNFYSIENTKSENLDESIHDVISKNVDYLKKSKEKFGEKVKTGMYKAHALAKKYPNGLKLVNAKKKLVNYVKDNLSNTNNFYAIPEEAELQESMSTMGRQLWDGIKGLFGGPSAFTAKRKYFNELYTIDANLKKKLVKMVNQVQNAVILPHSTLFQLISGKITQKEVDTTPSTTRTYNHKTGEYDTHVYSKTQTVYKTRTNIDVFHRDRANQNHDVSNITNATCNYILDMGNGKAALLFFTFDSKQIKAAQVLTSNKFSSGDALSKYDTTALPGWDSVSKDEYMKNGVQEAAMSEGFLNSTGKKLLTHARDLGHNVSAKHYARLLNKNREDFRKAGGSKSTFSSLMKAGAKMLDNAKKVPDQYNSLKK